MNMKKIAVAITLALLAGCSQRGPHYTSQCVQSHEESIIIPMAMPTGNGGVTMQMMPSVEDVCDASITYCEHKGKEVDDKYCRMMKELDHE